MKNIRTGSGIVASRVKQVVEIFGILRNGASVPRFGTAIFRAVKEGRLLYREAYNLTGLKGETFENMREKMGILAGT